MLEVVMVAVVHEPSEIADIDFLPFVVRRRNHLMEFVRSQKQGSWDQYLKLLLRLWWFDNSRNQRFWCNNWFRCDDWFRCEDWGRSDNRSWHQYFWFSGCLLNCRPHNRCHRQNIFITVVRLGFLDNEMMLVFTSIPIGFATQSDFFNFIAL